MGKKSREKREKREAAELLEKKKKEQAEKPKSISVVVRPGTIAAGGGSKEPGG